MPGGVVPVVRTDQFSGGEASQQEDPEREAVRLRDSMAGELPEAEPDGLFDRLTAST